MKKPSNLLTRSDLAPAREMFTLAAKASRDHTALAAESCKLYGNHGALISGIIRDHFPQNVKDRLTILAHAVTSLNEDGRNLRPARVQRETMNRLARAVCLRDGTGFYGYQV